MMQGNSQDIQSVNVKRIAIERGCLPREPPTGQRNMSNEKIVNILFPFVVGHFTSSLSRQTEGVAFL